MRTWIVGVIVVVGLVAGCGKKAADKDHDKDKTGPATASAGAGTEVKPPETARPTVVMPADVSADKALTVAELDAILKPWVDDAELSFVGYAAFYTGDDGELGTTAEVAAEPGQHRDKHIIRCDLAASERAKKVDNKTPLTFKGKLAGRWDQTMYLEACVLTGQGTAAKPDAVPGSAEPVAADKLAAAYLGWYGKELSVTGAYFGTTTSSKSEKDGGGIIDVRIDLLTKSGEMEAKVGCHLPLVKPDAALDALMEKNRPALTVTGTLKEFGYGPQLDPCTVTSK